MKGVDKSRPLPHNIIKTTSPGPPRISSRRDSNFSCKNHTSWGFPVMCHKEYSAPRYTEFLARSWWNHSVEITFLFSLSAPWNQGSLIKKWLYLVRLPKFMEVTVINLKISSDRKTHSRPKDA